MFRGGRGEGRGGGGIFNNDGNDGIPTYDAQNTEPTPIPDIYTVGKEDYAAPNPIVGLELQITNPVNSEQYSLNPNQNPNLTDANNQNQELKEEEDLTFIGTLSLVTGLIIVGAKVLL